MIPKWYLYLIYKMSIPWVYIWSDEYRVFHEYFHNTMREFEFRLVPFQTEVQTDNTGQWNFLKLKVLLDTLEGGLQTDNTGQWNFLKLKVLLDTLEGGLQTNSNQYIVFSDIDGIVKKDIYKAIKTYIDANDTMVFLQEDDKINTGFMLLKVCPEVIDFWLRIQKKMNETPENHHVYLNELIKEYKGKWTSFHPQKFTCTTTWDQTTDFSFLLPISSGLGKDLDFAEKLFVSAQHIDIQPYMKYVPESIYPSIYRFQELLYESHQEIKAAPNS